MCDLRQATDGVAAQEELHERGTRRKRSERGHLVVRAVLPGLHTDAHPVCTRGVLLCTYAVNLVADERDNLAASQPGHNGHVAYCRTR